MCPIVAPFFVIRSHDSILDGLCCSLEITSEQTLFGSRNIVQEAFCGRGKRRENSCKKMSSSAVSNTSVAWEPKAHDAMSAMTFSVPAMDTVINGDASFTWMWRDRARMSRAATHDLDELSLFAQLTVGVLSHHAATCTCLSSVRFLSTR